jgi:hypothetical protein
MHAQYQHFPEYQHNAQNQHFPGYQHNTQYPHLAESQIMHTMQCTDTTQTTSSRSADGVGCAGEIPSNTMTLAKVQVGLKGSTKALKRDLDALAARADTTTPQGLHKLLQGQPSADTVKALIHGRLCVPTPKYWGNLLHQYLCANTCADLRIHECLVTEVAT